MGKLIEALKDVSAEDLVMAVYNYGKEAHKNLYKDYQCQLVFNGNAVAAVDGVTDKLAVELAELYPEGYGVRFENPMVITPLTVFCGKVISKEISSINQKKNALSVDDPDNDSLRGDYDRMIAKLSGYAKSIKTEKVSGNGLQKDLTERGRHIHVIGYDNGDVKISVSRQMINEDNPGECIGTFPKTCDAPFQIMGTVRGLQGAVSAFGDQDYGFFHVEGKRLFLWKSWFNGKEKYADNELEFGQLIVPYPKAK